MHPRRNILRAIALLPLAGFGGCRHGPAGDSTLRITVSGQALMTRPLCAEPYAGFDEIVAELHRGDVVFTDLEAAIKTSRSGAPTRVTQFLHTAPPEVLGCLRNMGFNLLALSNNHAWDLGTDGILATREAVLAHGFVAAGTGPDLASASDPAVIEEKAHKVALVSMATEKIREGAAATATRPGVNELRLMNGVPHAEDARRILETIRNVRDRADIVIAYHHNHDWGDDMAVTRPWSRQWADRCVDAGAGIYLSHGAPLLHGIKWRGNVLQLFGLGSLVFHSRTPVGHYRPEVWETAIVHLDYANGRLLSVEVVPVVLNEIGDDTDRQNETRGRPRIARGAEAVRILNRLQLLTAAFGSELQIDGDRGHLRDTNDGL